MVHLLERQGGERLGWVSEGVEEGKEGVSSLPSCREERSQDPRYLEWRGRDT